MKVDSSRSIAARSSLRRSLHALQLLIDTVSAQHNLSFQQVVDLLHSQGESMDLFVPVSIFRERRLGIMEVLTKYLHEEKSLGFSKIAKRLGRDQRVVWMTYSKAKKKMPEALVFEDSEFAIPISIFSTKKHGPLEALSIYLRDTFDLSFKEIGDLLSRDNRSVWACYHKKKKTNG